MVVTTCQAGLSYLTLYGIRNAICRKYFSIAEQICWFCCPVGNDWHAAHALNHVFLKLASDILRCLGPLRAEVHTARI